MHSDSTLLSILKYASRIEVPRGDGVKIQLIKNKDDMWKIVSYRGGAWYWSDVAMKWIVSTRIDIPLGSTAFATALYDDVVIAYRVAKQLQSIEDQLEGKVTPVTDILFR